MTRAKDEQRNRGFCFTVNNYTEATKINLETLEGISYIVCGCEVGESGTPHIQGYVHFETPKTLKYVRGRIPGHIEVRRGSVEQAVNYCKKTGNFTEKGEIPKGPGKASKDIYGEILRRAKLGETKWIEDNYPKVWIHQSHRLKSFRETPTVILDAIVHEWWYGPTGTGKSRTVWELYPNHYQKELNKWWCGYENEEVVVIEEWSPKNECTGSQLKIWADRYPFTGQIKGGSLKKIRPLKIIVLSNYSIDDCFIDHRDSLPLKRRFTQLEFPLEIKKAVEGRAIMHRSNSEVTVSSSQEPNMPVPVSQTVELVDHTKACATELDEIMGPVPHLPCSDWTSFADDLDLQAIDWGCIG
nr:MAG: replication associated protein [Arizlama virus]